MAADELGDIRLFVEAAGLGSLSAAGRKLGFSAAAASARLTKLEASLQTKLFDRTTRSLRLTNEGHVYMQHCRVALEALENAKAELLAGQGQVRGRLRISATTDFGRHRLNQWLEEFCSSHPQLQLALTLTDSLSNLLEDDVDIAVRFGKPSDGDLVARLLAPNWRVLCAAPDYLESFGVPRTPEELHKHRFVILVNNAGPLNDYHFMANGQRWTQRIPMERSWETNDGALARIWAMSGHGITRKTIWDAAEDIRAGRLKVVLPEYTVEESGLYAIFHRNRYQVPRVQELLDFLVERFRKASHELLDGLPGAPASGTSRP
ncbi:LysR family transcriptional regulator [Ottowia sp. VDI28]|uniref:LysR family transcriptional regulator n=1 Tax=Ottowia sp. VDI28 TaxID=3133968 RepID=UPI003C2DF416